MRVLVLGGGYVAIWLARKLRRAMRRGEIELTVVDKHNFHTFHGLVPEMLVGKIQPGQIISPARRLFAPGRFICAEIEEIDLEKRKVRLSRSRDGRPLTVGYDQLVLNLGSVDDLRRYRGVGEHTLRLKDYRDCMRVRNHLLAMLELAESEPDPEERRRLLHFVVAGGNYAGVEVAAELGEFLRALVRREYPGIDPAETKLTLVHAGDRLLPELGRRFPQLSAHALRMLRRRGTQVELGLKLTSATPLEAVLSDGRRLATRTIISCTGTAQNPLLERLPFARDSQGRLIVDAFGRVNGRPGVWSAGDCGAIPMKNGESAPPLALYAMEGGRTIATNLLRERRGRPLRPYAFTGLGDCCVLGFGQAVGQLWGVPLKGWPAWLIWRACMIAYLPAWAKRVRTVLDWVTVPVFGRDVTSVGAADPLGTARELYEPGQAIVREGDVGRAMYLIEAGSVEVVRAEGAGERRLAVLRAGDHFGEIAVLQEVRRTATVRALEPVAVLRISRDQTHQLRSTFKPFAELTAARLATAQAAPRASD